VRIKIERGKIGKIKRNERKNRICCKKYNFEINLLKKGKQTGENRCHGMLYDIVNDLLFSGPARASALYPLNYKTKGRDVSLYRNRPGVPVGVRFAPGPDGKPRGSYRFFGRRNSYIYFPNNGRIDTKKSLTILAWIYHTGSSGPIFHYMPNGWGVHFWMVGRRTLFARLVKRGSRRSTPAISPNH